MSKIVPVDSSIAEGGDNGIVDAAVKDKPPGPAGIMANFMHDDDELYKKWSGPMLLGPFTLAVFAVIVIVSGEITLNTWTGSCGYALNCK